MNKIELLISIASDLTSALDSESRYGRLLESLRRIIPYDAASLLRIDGEALRVMAAIGLTEDVMGRSFMKGDHPRLEIICNAAEPVRFRADSRMPDPFDGLLMDETLTGRRIHSCLGCPLFADSTLIGVLTADAVAPDAFDGLDATFLSAIAALAGAEMHTTELMEALEDSAERMGLIARDLLRETQAHRADRMIGSGESMRRLRREINLVAGSDFTILITGETGVGKELVARAIHAASKTKDRPMLYLNCATLPETIAESELFGHVRGSFTGALDDRIGKFELAHGGTLFLDEIGELPISVQPKLLRALQNGEIQKIGAGQVNHVNVRLIAATNRRLKQEVTAGRFRADLFHRLNVYPIHVPPLRERIEDIPLLAGHFCELTQRRIGLGTVRLEQDALNLLKRYNWPGNIRELENVIARALLRASSDHRNGEQLTIGPHHLGMEFEVTASTEGMSPGGEIRSMIKGRTLREASDEFQRDLILRVVKDTGGNWSEAARRLGMHRSNLHKLAVRLKIH
ncbi:Anaerobic nitric oxide reductase transcription regulator NorR [Olavius algarvensis associated proteobacterium Delta 3]|nr:Anaerobic nitric oxide reductase transcription regulator NorR [Olavius algarvensis associated proteobacterium Delta 3]